MREQVLSVRLAEVERGLKWPWQRELQGAGQVSRGPVSEIPSSAGGLLSWRCPPRSAESAP
ncbi:hypothetical protein EMIT0P218_130008 [Pseudomonas sp. IT-P218]